MVVDFIFGVAGLDVIYDVESYPNVFTMAAQTIDGKRWFFELSEHRNDIPELCLFMDTLASHGCRMVGFNNVGFDYPVLHYIYLNKRLTAYDVYRRVQKIINTPHDNKFSNLINESEWIVKQVDLFKIHHFDNLAKSTSLKILQFNMRSENVADLPFPVGTDLTNDQLETLRLYNFNDVTETINFYKRSLSQIKMRDDLNESTGLNLTNDSDIKIGEKILIQEMEKNNIICYERVNGRRKMRQTVRDKLVLNDCILPYISLNHPEFNRVLEYVRKQVITETKGVFNGVIATVDGVVYKFGTGGLHASVESSVVESSDTHQLIDVDVKSYYPNLAIENLLFPAHTGSHFCKVYKSLYETRKGYPKGSAGNEAYKLALNGAYGNSNNAYSPLFDPLFTMTITLSGQFSLCMLIEQLIKIPDLSIIQVNTDGVTYLCPHQHIQHAESVCKWWQSVTKLELESVNYNRMFIRDVNNYIAEGADGSVKRIGAYASQTALENAGTRELPWHKNWSARVVQLAACDVLLNGGDVRSFIEDHNDVFDFMLRTKIPRSSTLEHGTTTVPNIVRYYVSTDGKPLTKVMPAKGVIGTFKRKSGISDFYYDEVLASIGEGVHDERIHTKNKSVHEVRRIGLHTGSVVTLCNDLSEGLFMCNLDFEWYIKEAEKLVKPLQGV